jgi:hypothetical protein
MYSTKCSRFKCSRLGCKNDNCDHLYQGIGHICKLCWKDFIEYLYSKYPKSCVDTNIVPEKLVWADLKFFMENNIKK